MAASTTLTTALFDQFRKEIDDHNDTRERLIKASRDITNLSKKTIFLLHRMMLKDLASTHDTTSAKHAAKLGYDKLREVQTIFATISVELQGDGFWRYQRQVSPGLQEYIEALSFAHFLDHGSLITFDQVQTTLSDPEGNPVHLTGELMRFAISGISQKGGRKKASDVCVFVRNCKADFERITPYIHELKKKQAVTAQSLEKIEDAAYAIVIRSSEYDLPTEILDDIVTHSISKFTRIGDHGDDVCPRRSTAYNSSGDEGE